jgi:hypothetical protein
MRRILGGKNAYLVNGQLRCGLTGGDILKGTQMDMQSGQSDGETASDYSIGEVIRFVTSSLPLAILGALIVGLISLAILLLARVALPEVATFRTALVITMPNSADGKYPNGSDFAITDLRSTAVMEQVYRSNNLSDYGLKLDKFLGMVSVEAYSPAFDNISDRFRARLDNKTLNFEERKIIEGEYAEALKSLKSNAIMVSLSVPESSKIPDSVAKKTVDDIPAAWADVYINQLGVANLPLAVSGADLVDKAYVSDLDFPLAYDYLVGQSDRLVHQIESISNLPGSISLISKSSGKSISDLQRDLEAIREFRLELGMKPIVDQGLSRDPSATLLTYVNKISSLEKDASAQSQYAGKVSIILGDLRTNTNSAASGTVPSANAAAQIAPQFDAGFVDKILELSKGGETLEFEKGLLEAKLKFENTSVGIMDRRARMFERRDALLNSTLTTDARAALEKKFTIGMDQATIELNALWGESKKFVEELGAKRFNYDKALYQLNELAGEKRVERSSLINRYFLLVLSLALIVGGLIGFVIFGWRRALHIR